MKVSKKSKKAQGLPMYAIGIIIIGIIILALVLIFIFGVSGQGTTVLERLFGAQESVTTETSEAVSEFTGQFFRNLIR